MLTKIEEGKTYRLRNGQVVTAYNWQHRFMSTTGATGTIKFKHFGVLQCWGDGRYVGQFGSGISDEDIVEEVCVYQQEQLELF